MPERPWKLNDIFPLSIAQEEQPSGGEWTSEYWGPWTSFFNAASGADDRSGSVAVSGGGDVAVTGQEGAQRQIVVSGGGFLNVKTETARFGSLAVTGGGDVAVTGQEGAQRQMVVSGGGNTALVHTTARFAAIAVSGGGAATVSGSPGAEEHSGSVTVTGGGSVTVTGSKGAAGEVVVSGAGAVSVTTPVVEAPLAGGVFALGRENRRQRPRDIPNATRIVEAYGGRARVTGGGSVSVEGEKNGIGLVVVTGGGEVRAEGQRRHPKQNQELAMAIAMAA